MSGDPPPFRTRCGAKRDRPDCGREIELRVTGTREDGSPRWHPFNVGPGGASTNQSHFDSCPMAQSFRSRGRKPGWGPHEHDWVDSGTRVLLGSGMGVRLRCRVDGCPDASEIPLGAGP